VHAVLLDPLPYPDPNGIVILRHVAPGEGAAEGGQSDGTYQPYRRHARTLSEIGVYYDRDLSLTDGERPERISAALATPSVLRVLRVPPLLGRVFIDEDLRSLGESDSN
jgi:hypothetical protein